MYSILPLLHSLLIHTILHGCIMALITIFMAFIAALAALSLLAIAIKVTYKIANREVDSVFSAK